MAGVGRKHGRGADEIIADAKIELGPARCAIREAEIARLPTVQWKGRTLYTLRCHGTSGRGPHDVNVPLMLVWHLIDLRSFYCVYHAADCWDVDTKERMDWP